MTLIEGRLNRPSSVALIAISLIAITFTVALAHASTSQTSLVSIRRAGPAPSHQTAFWRKQTFHHSQLVFTYQDLSTGPWHVWLTWQGCPTTSRGALRLTLYKTVQGGTRLLSHKDAVAKMTLYSRTLIERQPSGSSAYAFPGSQETYFLVKVDVLSKRGCSFWRFGSETN